MPDSLRRLRPWLGDHTSTRLPFGATTLRPDFEAARAFGASPLSFLRDAMGSEDVLKLHLGFTEFHLVIAPELVRRILVAEDARFGEGKWTQRGHFVMGDCLITREGALHRERRQQLQPAFQDFDATAHAVDMQRAIEKHTDPWRAGDTLEMRNAMGRIALAIASQFLFSEDPQDHHPQCFEDLWRINSAISRPPVPRPALLAAQRRLRKMAGRMRRGAVVAALQQAGASSDEIDREIIALMIASIDTTPGTLSWIWTRLAEHPKVEAGLHEELAASSGTAPAPAAGAHGKRGQALEHIVAEVLRLHPPVRFVDRRVLEDMDLGGTPVRSGDYVLLSPLLTHRDGRYWSDPDAFAPDRWQAGQKERTERLAYFPFGAGPHACIGGALAQREISMIVTTLARRWRFRSAGPKLDPQRIPARFDMRLELRS